MKQKEGFLKVVKNNSSWQICYCKTRNNAIAFINPETGSPSAVPILKSAVIPRVSVSGVNHVFALVIR